MKPSLFQIIAAIILLHIIPLQSNSQDLNPADWPHLKGYWKFQDTTDLTKATVGNDLILVGNQQWVQGAFYGDTAVRIDTGSYYRCYHGISPNGGGDSVNRYTLMFDFKVLSLNKWHCFFQTDSTNQNDGECFIKHWGDSIAGSIGVGHTGYSSDSIEPNKWYRLVITVNLGNFYNYYLDGKLLHVGDTEDIYIDSRFALTPQVLFFADNNNEDDTIDIASVAIFDTCLTPAQIAQIGTLDPCIENPPTVSIGNDTTIVAFSDTLTFSAGTMWKSVLWSTGDTIPTIKIDSSMIKNPYLFDTVWVEVTDMNDCKAYDTVYYRFESGSGIPFNRKSFKPVIYPNPATNIIYIVLKEKASKIMIMDINGKVIRNLGMKKQGRHKFNINLPSGIYLIQIRTKTGIYINKIIVNKNG